MLNLKVNLSKSFLVSQNKWKNEKELLKLSQAMSHKMTGRMSHLHLVSQTMMTSLAWDQVAVALMIIWIVMIN